MMNNKLILLLCVLSAALLSIPWLVPHAGFVALVAFVPLLCADYIATGCRAKRFFGWYFLTFLLWNAATTFWVGGATVGGAVFAIVANALQMALVFALFRFGKRRLGGVLPYVLLVAAWIAWEKLYFHSEISWPWLTLGNAFAASTKTVQWYSVTGVLGGSLWVWMCNLAVFGFIVGFADGKWWRLRARAQMLLLVLSLVVVAGPFVASALMYNNFDVQSGRKVDVLVGQPNFDPYHKFESMSQEEQTAALMALYDEALDSTDAPALLLAPETFTSDIYEGGYVEDSPTVASLRGFAASNGGPDVLLGASTYRFFPVVKAPSPYAYRMNYGWLENYNSAVMLSAGRPAEIYHKSKLVIGTELTPYPKVFLPIERFVGRIIGQDGPLMGRCVPQKDASVLHMSDGTVLGCAVCYESVYPDYCRRFVRKGAEFISVITNDAWWGDTPGYRQHFNYSRLLAIQLRRDVARCANTGISAFIDCRGDVAGSTSWWTPETLRGEVTLRSSQCAFVRYGDIVGRVAVLVLILMAFAWLVGVRAVWRR